MGRVKESVRGVLSTAFVRTGVCAAARTLSPKRGALILYGHRVSNDDDGYLQGLRPEWFEEQISYLVRHYQPLSLSELVRCHVEAQPIPARSFVVTFDDGFKDNLENAAPILARYDVPATIFVVTGSISSGELPWSQRLGWLFQYTDAGRVDAGQMGLGCLDLSNENARRSAYLGVKTRLRGMRRVEREQILEELSTLLDVAPPRDRMLGWDDLRTMMREGWEVGAHTRSHPLLAEIPPDEAEAEIHQSVSDLEEHLGLRGPSFCFPGGSWTSSLVDVVKNAGCRSVFQSRPDMRVNTLESSDRFSLSRVGFSDGRGRLLEAELDGPFFAIRSLYRRS